MLYDVGYGMTQVAIGNNLLIRPWIETLVRLNNSFIVKRNVPVRQMLEVSKVLSAYIRRTITETKESIWIAQREGRAKDSDDRTQGSILKMLNMSGDKDILSNLMELNIFRLQSRTSSIRAISSKQRSFSRNAMIRTL